jgi:hypothetical protein
MAFTTFNAPKGIPFESKDFLKAALARADMETT